MFQPRRKISLNLPTSYNRCSLRQLRDIATIMLDLAGRATKLRPFQAEDLKTAVFFQLSGLEVLKGVDSSLPIEDQFYLVRFREGRWRRLTNRFTHRNEPFPLYLWQVAGWLFNRVDPKTRKNMPGMLDWLDGEGSDFFVVFPFEQIRRKASKVGRRKMFKGPNPMLDGFTWQRYRFAQDYMLSFVNQQNRMVQLLRLGRKVTAKEIQTEQNQLEITKALFLANLFEGKMRYTDGSTGMKRCDWHYHPEQADRYVEYFRDFPDVDWQIILLWWSGVMGWLSKTYPRVFKKQNPSKNQKQSNPLELYARTTATIEKYVGLTADEVDGEPYTTILQQMEDIVAQNEENERISREMKRK